MFVIPNNLDHGHAVPICLVCGIDDEDGRVPYKQRHGTFVDQKKKGILVLVL